MKRLYRQFLARLARKLGKVAAAAVLGAALLGPASAGAQQTAPLVKFKEDNKLEANGDARLCYEIRLPQAAYTQLKKNTPNTALFIRKMGLNNQNMVIQDAKGEWIDGDSTLRIEFTALGIARAVKGDAWEVPLSDGIDTELLAVSEGTAILTQACVMPGIGLATNNIRVKLPAGATEVRALKSPGRLTYKLAAPAGEAGQAAADFDVEAKPQIMSSLAKAMSNRQFAALWTARTRFKNSGTAALKDYRVRFRIAEYAPTWSPWQGTPLVVPGQTVIDSYFPVFDMEKLGKLTGQTRVAMEVQYQYKKPGGQPVEESDTREMTLLSRNQVFYSSLKPEDCVDFADISELMPAVLASFVTHEDPVIQQAAGRIANWVGGANATGSDEEAIKYARAVYQFMAANIAYQTPPTGESEKVFQQHVKYGRDVLKNKAGTCIDLAILYGSLCQAVGLDPVLYAVPGHCFPAVKLPKSGRVLPVESTLIGHGGFEDAVKCATENQFKPIDEGRRPFTKVDVGAVQKLGALPMDLPNLGEDPLDKWGIKVPAAQPADARPGADAPRAAGPKAPEAAEPNFVGTWGCRFVVNGVQVAQVVRFTAEGRYEGASKLVGPRGTSVIEDSGTYSVDRKQLVLKSSVTGVTLVRPYRVNGDGVDIEMQEVGQTVTFRRTK
ncbi:MAG TPA: hypothetical protein VFW33_07075 [Gemmataceae bacterium]|nr:hypothetical protein [Gemmataceae bacterium]